MNYLAITGFFTFIFSFLLSIYILLNKKVTLLNIVVSIFTILLSFWGLSLYFMSTLNSPLQVVNWATLLTNIALVLSVLLITFVFVITDVKIKINEIYILSFSSILIIVLSRMHPNLYISNVKQIFLFNQELMFPEGAKLFYCFVLIYSAHILYALYLLSNYVIKEQKNDLKIRFLKGMNISFLFGFLSSIFFYLSFVNDIFSQMIVVIIPIALLIGTYFFIKYNMQNFDIEWGYYATQNLYSALFIILNITILYLLRQNLSIFVVVSILMIFIFPVFHNWLKQKIKDELYKTKYLYISELNKLAQDTEKLNSASKKEILNITFEKLTKILNLENLAIFTREKFGLNYNSLLLRGYDEEEKNIGAINCSEKIIKFLESRRLNCDKNFFMEHRELEALTIMNYLKANLVFPLFCENELYAVIFLGVKKNTTKFSVDDIKTIEHVIKTTEKIIEKSNKILNSNNTLENEFDLDIDTSKEFIRQIKRLIETENVDELANSIVNFLRRDLEIKNVAFYVYAQHEKSYLNVFSNILDDDSCKNYCEDKIFYKYDDFVRILHSKAEIIDIKNFTNEDILNSEKYQKTIICEMEKLKAEIVLPIVMDELLGFLVLDVNNDSIRSKSGLAKLNFISHALAMTLHSLMYSDENIKDPVTKIYNRYYFPNLIEETIMHAFNVKTLVSLIFIDNDFDEKAEDFNEKIKIFVKSIKIITRVSDILCRYSDKEIALILPETDYYTSKAIIDRLFDAFPNIHVGISTLNPNNYADVNFETLDSAKEMLMEEAYNAMKNDKSKYEKL